MACFCNQSGCAECGPGVPRPLMTVRELLAALTWETTKGCLRPDDVLAKNAVGNLSIMRDGRTIGYLELGALVVDEIVQLY